MSTVRERMEVALQLHLGHELRQTTMWLELLDALVAASQPRVERERILAVFEQHDHKYPNREAWLRAIVPAIQQLLTGQPERKAKNNVDTCTHNIYALGWKYCPNCGRPNLGDSSGTSNHPYRHPILEVG